MTLSLLAMLLLNSQSAWQAEGGQVLTLIHETRVSDWAQQACPCLSRKPAFIIRMIALWL